MFSAAIEKAIRISIAAHEGQLRKGGDVPYVSHPLHVALILAQAGADAATIQAGLLHDVVEDCDGWTPERVEHEFGREVRDLVAAVSEDKSQSWEERKQSQIDHVEHMSDSALLVKAADKLHNLSSLVAELKRAESPSDVWQHFSRGSEQTVQVAEELVATVAARLPQSAQELRASLEAVLVELQAFRV